MKRLIVELCVLICAASGFATTWTYGYDATAKCNCLMDESGWKFPVTLNKKYTSPDGVAVTGALLGLRKAVGTDTSLDFSNAGEAIGQDVIGMESTFYTGGYQTFDKTIQSVTLPNTVVYLYQTFRNCSVLTEVTPLLPTSVFSVGERLFQGTKVSGKLLELGRDNKKISVSGSSLFSGVKVEEAYFGDGVTTYPAEFLRDSTTLTKVRISPSATSIGDNAFRGCSALVEFTPLLPTTLTSIGSYAFYGDSALTGDLVLGGTTPLSVGTTCFINCGVNSIALGDGVTAIPSSCFSGCSKVTNVTFNTTLKTIADNGFDKMTGVKTAANFLPPTVTYIGAYAFRNWTSYVGSLTLGDGETGAVSMGWETKNGSQFNSMSGLTNVLIGAGVATLPNNCFFACKAITEVEFFGYTTWSQTSWGGQNANNSLPDYKARFLLPFNNTQWTQFIATDSMIVAWDDDKHLAGYQERFGADAKKPTALVNTYGSTAANRRQYLVVKAGAAGAKPLGVTGEPGEYGTPEPAYGNYDDVGKSLPLTCRMTTPTTVVGNTRYECWGCELSEVGEATVPVTNTVLTFTYDPKDEKLRQIKWLWRPVGYKPTIVYPAELGTVTCSTPGADDCYTNGATATFTATPAAGVVFGGWYGDVDEAQRQNPTISVVMDGEKIVTPYFVMDWVLANDGKSINDGYWTLAVSGSASALTVTKQTTRPILFGLLDLRKPVVGGVIQKVGSSFAGGQGTYEYLTELRLPDTLTSIGDHAFRNQVNLKTVYPSFPDSVTYYGYLAFGGCEKLEGDIRIGMDENTSVTFYYAGSSGEGAVFQGLSRVDTVTLGPGVHTVPGAILNNCSNIKEITVMGGDAEIRSYAFRMYHESTTPQTPVFRLAHYPTNGWGACVFQNWWAKRTCVYLPRDNEQWRAWMQDPEKMTPWKDLPTSDQQAFSNNFPGVKNPIGLSVENDNQGSGPIFRKQWIFTWRPFPPKGLTVILR